MTDPAAVRRSFLHAQVAALEPLAFVVVGLPQPPFDALQARREEDDTFVVELASRDTSAPFTPEQAAGLGALDFKEEGQTWVAPAVKDADAAVDLVERVLTTVLGVEPATAIDLRHGTLRDERAAAAKLEEMRAFIGPVLQELVGVAPTIDEDGDFVLDLHGMRVFVAPRALPGRPPIIRVFCITNAGLNLSSELGLFLARVNFSLAFGRFSIDVDHGAVWFDETLLGDQVTPEELRFVVEIVAETAGEWDERIASMFGGRFRETDASGAPAPEAVTTKPGEGGYL